MGLIEGLLNALFGQGRNIVKETAEVFRVNAEAEAGRELDLQGQVLQQFGLEFRADNRSRFDQVMDALNRIPRPAMALGTLGLFVAAMIDPIWFAARMAGIALVPEPLWWLLAAIVSFYFGARHQAKGQQFQREIAASLSTVPQVMQTVRDVEAMRGPATRPAVDAAPLVVEAAPDTRDPDLRDPDGVPAEAVLAENRALADWQVSGRA